MKAKGLIAAVLLTLPFLAGCASITSPDGWASPEIVEDTVFVSLEDGEISALDVGSLDEQWTFPASDEATCPGRDDELDLDGIYGAPAIGEDIVYIGAYDGYIYALDRESGECRWSFETDDPVIAGPLLDGERLYAPSTDGTMYVLDATNGDQVEVVETGSVAATPLLSEDDYLYVATESGKLWKFSTDPLTPIWTPPFETRSGLLTPPVATGNGRVVVGGIGARMFGVDSETRAEAWSHRAGNWFWGEPVVFGEGVDQIVIATNLDGKVYGLNAGTGEEAWAIDTGDPIRAGAALTDDGTVVVVNNPGIVVLIDAETGEEIDRIDLKEGVYASPVIHEGEALILTRSRDIFRVNIEERSVEQVTLQ